jgi:hypothetical protein
MPKLKSVMQKTDFDLCQRDKNCNAKLVDFDKWQVLWYGSEKGDRAQTGLLQKSIALTKQYLSKIVDLKHPQVTANKQ